jgi:hypothetical protein
MILGKSHKHVKQDVGKYYSKSNLEGYYNDLTLKVLKNNKKVEDLPLLEHVDGSKIEFSIQIFQYGLALYDLYISTSLDKYLITMYKCLEWAISNQNTDGSWNTFSHVYPNNPYSSMAQGEGVSLLLRGYKVTKNKLYLELATKAINFMIKSVKNGGTTEYMDIDIYLKEFTHRPTVLNGWIFSIFGLFDYYKVTKDQEIYNIMIKSVNTLKNRLCNFDKEGWSFYNIDGSILSSPFYHNLHISLLYVLSDIFEIDEFKNMAMRWKKSYKNVPKRLLYFAKKAKQKIMED